MLDERANAQAVVDAMVIRNAALSEQAHAQGYFTFTCFGADGQVKWRDIVDNTVVVVGRNLMLDAALAGSGYTVTGPFMGLISGTSFSGVSPNDTMASHAGWKEAGGITIPTYTGNRDLVVWAPANNAAKTLTVPLSFSITADGTIKGGFLCYGPGAVATKDSNTGVLWSAGIFVSGDKPVTSGDVIRVSYATSL